MAFLGVLRLNGVLTQELNGKPLEYCFEYVQTNPDGSIPAGNNWIQVPLNWIYPTKIGTVEVFWPHFAVKDLYINGNPSDPNVVQVSVTSDGWIQVPQGPLVSLTQDLINLNSGMLPAFSQPTDETNVTAGSSANYATNPPASPAGQLYFGLRMRVRQTGSSGTQLAGTCIHVAINNTTFANVNQHSKWDGGVVSLPYGIAMVDILELQNNGCANIVDKLHVLFTAYSPNLGIVDLSLKGNGVSGYQFDMPPPTTPDYHGTATPSTTTPPPNGWSISSLPSCAYTVVLTVNLLLTDGDGHSPNPLYDYISFCTKAAQESAC